MRESAAVALVALLLGLAACGGDGEASMGSQGIRGSLITALTSRNPSVCTQLMTARYRAQRNLTIHPPEALRKCRRDLAHGQATAVSIAHIDAHGASATARLHTVGGWLPFARATLMLRRIDGAWRLNRLVGARLDRPRFFAVARDKIKHSPDRPDSTMTDCVVRGFKKWSNRQIVAMYVAGNFSRVGIETLACG